MQRSELRALCALKCGRIQVEGTGSLRTTTPAASVQAILSAANSSSKAAGVSKASTFGDDISMYKAIRYRLV